MSFDPVLLDGLLVCTKCRRRLVRAETRLVCVSPECRMKFEIRDEIPNMLLEEASALPVEEWRAVMQETGRDPATGAPRSGS